MAPLDAALDDTALATAPVRSLPDPEPTARPDDVEGWGARPELRGARGAPAIAVGDNSMPPVTEKMKLPAERYDHLEKENPQLHQIIDKVAGDVGVPAIDLANIAYASSGFKQDTPGGYMNVSPQTAQRLDPDGHFNPQDPVDNVYLGAVKYKELADHFGVSTSSALGAYGMNLETIQQMAGLSPEDQRKHFPQVFDYLRRLSSGITGKQPGMTAVADEPQKQEYQPPLGRPSGEPSDEMKAQLRERPTGDEPPQTALEMQQAPTEMPRGAPYSGGAAPVNPARQQRQQAIAAAGAPEMQQAPTIMSTALDLSGNPAPPEPQRPVPGPTASAPAVPGETRDLAGNTLPPPAPPVDVQKIDPYSGQPLPPATARAGVPPDAGSALAVALPGAPLPPPERSRADTLPFAPTTGSGASPAAALAGAPAGAPAAPPATGTSTPPPPAPAGPAPAPGAPAGAPAPRQYPDPNSPRGYAPEGAPAPPGAPGQPTAAQLNQDELARIRAGQPPGPPGAPIPNVQTPSGAVAQPVGQGGGQGGAGPAAPAVGPGRAAGEPPPVTAGANFSMPGLVRAGMQGGPQGFMSNMVATAPRGMSTNDMWASVDNHLQRAFILRGDMVGAQRAAEYVFQMQHAGSNQAMMQAYGALAVGDAVGAANLLAKAHAFVPDGSTMAFKVGPPDPRTGQPTLWGQRFVDATGQPVGNPLMITPQGIAGMLNQTRDPQQFLKTLNTERQTIAKIAHNQNMEGLRNKAIDVGAGTATANRQERGREADQGQAAATARTQAQIDAANQRAAAADQRMRDIAAGRKSDIANARRNAITKEADALYSDQTSPTYVGADMTPDQRAQSQDIHAGLRTYNPDMQSGTAQQITGNVLGGKYSLRPTADGRYAVLNKPDNSGTVVAYLPATAMRVFGRGAGETPAPAATAAPAQAQPRQAPTATALVPPPPQQRAAAP